ncbi:hypothetical protein IAI14_30785, partial [Escherichia coli]|uniref:nucleotide-binding domain containing protein n=1 Tax=Escherichia coli TaxID=562 RepID=UPI00198FB455
AAIARGLRELGVRKFVVAGGETSGAVVQALDVKSLQIGAQIDPGVPATATIDAQPLGLRIRLRLEPEPPARIRFAGLQQL